MSTIEGRADDYEKRLHNAGSTDDLIGGLVKGIEKNRRLTRWLAASIVLDLVLSLGFGGLAYVANQNAQRSFLNAQRISATTDLIEKTRTAASYESCVDSVMVLSLFNEAQRALADLERVAIKRDSDNTLGLNPVREKRIRVYEESLVPIPECGPKPAPANNPDA